MVGISPKYIVGCAARSPRLPGVTSSHILRQAQVALYTMDCPVCHAKDARRSRRRAPLDYVFSAAGIVPWRCRDCRIRFHARPIPFSHMLYAHCSICGNLELQRISPEYVSRFGYLIARLLHRPALRCAPCRHKFLSLRPIKHHQTIANHAEDRVRVP